MIISDFLKTRKVTITKAADCLGISRTILSKIIHEKSPLTPEIAKRFEAVFGLSTYELLEEQASQIAKKQIASPVSSICQSNPFFSIDSLDIESWAEEIDSRKCLPQLIRILILSTSKGTTGIDFPANEDSQRPGFDGKLHAQESHPWIPLGDSYWEMGVNKNPKAKLVLDVEKSANKLNPAQRKKSVLVFVTPRRLKSEPKDLDELKAKYGWKDIRILDASILEQWVECSVEAQVWLFKQLKRDTTGIETCRMRLNRWLEPAKMQSFASILFDELVNELSERFRKLFLRNEKKLCSIAADSEGEASAFLFYTQERLLRDKDYQTEIASKQILFFNTPESVKAIPPFLNNIIAVTSNEAVKKKLLEHPNAHFIWIETTDQKRQQCDIALHPISQDSLFKAAKKTRLSDSDALVWENVSCGSITALNRFLSGNDSSLYPAWTKNESDIDVLIPLLFAGAWETSDRYSDKGMVCELNADGATERSIEKGLSHFLNLENSPLWQEASSCGVKSKRDLFLICESRIVQSDYENALSVIRKALTTPPEDPNLFATASSNEKHISSLLRKNLADTLVLLARNSQSIQTCQSFEIREEVDRTIAEILDHWDIDSFQAYDDCLESFALAAPTVFLDFFEKNDNLCRWMMCPVTNPFFGKSPRPAFLDALKVLCWEEVTFERAACLLAQLAKIEPQDNLGNKPSRTLQLVFSSYFVHSGVSTQKRIKLLQRLTEKDSNAFWEICHSDLVSQPHSAPWAPPPAEIRPQSYRCCTSPEDMEAMLKAKENLLFSKKIEWTDSRINDLIDILENISPQNRKTVIAIAEKWSRNATTEAKQKLQEHIERRIQYAFRKDDSPITSAEIHKLEQLCKKLTPKTAEDKILFLFSPEAYHQVYRKERDIKPLENRQKEALRTWKSTHGINGILQLISIAKINTVQNIAGYSSTILSNTQISRLICEALKSKLDRNRLHKMLIGLLFTPKEKVLNFLAKKSSEEDLMMLLELIPPGRVTGLFVHKNFQPQENFYWQKVNVTDLYCDVLDDALLVAEKLLSVQRFKEAFEFTELKHESFPPQLLLQMLKGIGNTTGSEELKFLVNVSYAIEKALEIISASPEIDQRDKVILEIMFSRLLVPTGSPDEPPLRNLTDYILKDPSFFVNLISYVTKKEDFGYSDSTSNNDKKLYWQIMHTLNVMNLDHQTPPPTLESKPNYLQWSHKLQEIAIEKDIQDNTEYFLGEILGRHNRDRFQRNPGRESAWFNPDYCEIIEALGTPKLLRGFHIGLYNSIGVHTRTLNGDSDRRIAKVFEEDVRKTQDYPKVQHVFQKLQKEFELSGQNGDENLKKMQRTRYLDF